jgi:hypothetical protein
MKSKPLSDLEQDYDLELERAIEQIKKQKSKIYVHSKPKEP